MADVFPRSTAREQVDQLHVVDQLTARVDDVIILLDQLRPLLQPLQKRAGRGTAISGAFSSPAERSLPTKGGKGSLFCTAGKGREGCLVWEVSFSHLQEREGRAVLSRKGAFPTCRKGREGLSCLGRELLGGERFY